MLLAWVTCEKDRKTVRIAKVTCETQKTVKVGKFSECQKILMAVNCQFLFLRTSPELLWINLYAPITGHPLKEREGVGEKEPSWSYTNHFVALFRGIGWCSLFGGLNCIDFFSSRGEEVRDLLLTVFCNICTCVVWDTGRYNYKWQTVPYCSYLKKTLYLFWTVCRVRECTVPFSFVLKYEVACLLYKFLDCTTRLDIHLTFWERQRNYLSCWNMSRFI